LSKITLSGNASGTGTFTIASPGTNTDRTLNLPDNSGTLLSNASTTGFPAGSVLQVVSNVNTNNFTTNSQNVFVTTSQSLSITPSSASSKVLVMFSANSVTTFAANTAIYIEVRRSGTVVCRGDYYTATVGGNQTVPFGVIQSLDSPNTTSPVTYEVFAAESGVPGTVGLNANRVLTLMEIAG
jgi:hypothetical protein